MALVIYGKTKCKICGLELICGDAIISFPAFIYNDLDPLIDFNDSAFHNTCFFAHKLHSQVLERNEAIGESELDAESKYCFICGLAITDVNDFLFIGNLTPMSNHPLSKWNYKKLHLSCLKNWSEIDDILSILKLELESGKLKGSYFDSLLRILSFEER